VPVERPLTVQATALGVAYLAGLAVGVWSGVDELRHAWRSGGVFRPQWSESEREERFAAWHKAAASATGDAPRG
jgi:glycerol kinase